MKFGISITIDKKAEHKSHLIIALSEALKEYFQDKKLWGRYKRLY